jgi:hypothetical protein
MIGDTLFDCGEGLDHYLNAFRWPAEVERRVRRLRRHIQWVQRWLDTTGAEALANLQPAGEKKLIPRAVVEARVRQILLDRGYVLRRDETHGDFVIRDVEHHLVERDRCELEDLAREFDALHPGEVLED